MLNVVHKLIAVNIFLLASLAGSAQEELLGTYVERALAANPTILQQRLLETEGALAVELAAAKRRLTADFRSDYIVTAGGRGIDLPIGDLLNPVYGTLNRLTDSESFPTDLDNVTTRFLPSNFHDTRIEVQLPLLQPLIGREVALREAQLLETRAGTAVLENEIRRQVRELYYAYRQSEAGIRIVDSSRLVVRELLRVNRSLVRNAKVTRDAVYRTEADLAALDARAAELEQQRLLAQAALNRLLDRDLATTIPPAADPLLPGDRDLDLTALSTRGRARRPELRQLAAGSAALGRLEELQAAGRRPTLGLLASAGAQGTLDGVDLERQPYGTLGVGFRWNIVDGKQRDLQQQRTRLRAAQLDQQRVTATRGIEFEIWRAVQRMRSERAQLAATRSRARAAAVALEIVRSRYRNQGALPLEVLDARNELTTARLDQNLAYYRLLQADAALQAALGE